MSIREATKHTVVYSIIKGEIKNIEIERGRRKTYVVSGRANKCPSSGGLIHATRENA